MAGGSVQRGADLQRRAGKLAAFLLHLLALMIAAFFAYRHNVDRLFFHYDGSYALIDALRQRGAHHGLFELWTSFSEGLGTFQFVTNYRLFPFFWPISYAADTGMAKVFVYLLMTVALFGATYATARIFSLPARPSLLAGWAVCLLALPILPRGFFYEIFSIAPPFLLISLTGPVALGTILLIRPGRLIAIACAVVILLALAAHLLVVAPILTVPIGFGAMPYVAAALVASTSRQELKLRIAGLGTVVAIAAALRWPWYLYGLFSFTAAQFHTPDFTSPYSGDPQYISLLFQSSILGWPGPILVVLALIGAVLACRSKEGRLRVGAYVLFGFFAVILVARLAFALVASWVLPPPVYVEIALWPLYASYGAFAVFRIVAFARAIVEIVGSPPLSWSGKSALSFPCPLQAAATATLGGLCAVWRAAGRLYLAVVSISPALPSALAGLLVTLALSYSKEPTSSIYLLPPVKPPIIEALAQQIAIKDGDRFKGRVATLFPVTPKYPINPWDEAWLQQVNEAAKLIRETGNDHLSTGLWWYRIPTLFEYNQFVSPALHALARQALIQTPYPQQRNVTIFTRPNQRILELLGVSYVISPASIDLIGAVRQTETIAGETLRLSELADPNLGSYSPTIVERAGDIPDAIRRVAADGFDPKTTVISNDDLAGPLVPLTNSAISYDGEDLLITASSPGRSLVVLPREYSRCLELAHNAPSNATLHRVDGLLAGILFDKDLRATLRFRIGPFHDPTCRYEDAKDFRGSR
jgi:hypothetical protein